MRRRPGRPRRRLRRTSATSLAATASRRSRSTGPRCATPSGPQTLDRDLATRSSARARTPTVGVIVLTGEGPHAFCSGGDQRVRGDTGYVAERRRRVGRFHVTDLHVQIRRLPKPVVAMVAGYAIGGGHVLHLVCDLTIAADNARFGQTGPRSARSTAASAPALLARLVGPKKAKEIWFLCRQYDAQQALDMGLVNTVVPLERLEEETVAVVPRDARALAVRAAAAEGELPRRTRTAWRASSSSPTTPTSSSTPARRRRRAARPTRRSARPTSRSSRSGRERA